MTPTQHARWLVRSWRERAKFRRGDGGPIDTDGKMLLHATADIYDACADELARALKLTDGSAEPCGCDPGCSYVCEQHQRKAAV